MHWSKAAATRVVLIATAVTAVAFAAASLWFGEHEPARAASDSGHGRPEGQRDQTSGEGNAREIVEAGPGLLKLSIVEGGAPAPGTVYWVTSEDPGRLHSRLGALPDLSAPESVQRVSHQGTVDVDVPAAHWLWLWVRGTKAMGVGAYLRLAPFSSVVERTLVLDSDRRCVHVFTLRDDYRTPAAGETVRLFSSAMGDPGLTQVKESRADQHGFTSFAGLGPGVYSVCAPGAEPEDPFPHALRIVLQPGIPPNELPCTLVSLGERTAIKLEVEAGFEPRAGLMRPKIFLKRKDDGSGALYPQAGQLAPGYQEIEMSVPVGRYEVGVLPLGELIVHPDTDDIEVRGSAPVAQVFVTSNPNRTRVELLGMKRNEFPVRVTTQAVDETLDDQPDVTFLGRNLWQTDSAEVPSLSGSCRLVALGRSWTYISEGPVDVRGPRIAVRMKPGTVVRFAWSDWDPRVDQGAFVEIKTGDGWYARGLAAQLLPHAGTHRAALVGEVIVPRGDIVAICLRPDGTSPWAREITADRHRALVRVGN